MTDGLLIIGALAAAVFVVVVLVEGAVRPDYDPIYHTGSELSLGDRGWVQITNFLQVGVGMLAYAAGIYRVLDTLGGAVLLAISGLALIAAGVFVVDPRRGYPPDAVYDDAGRGTWHHQLHEVTGPVAFIAMFGACVIVAGQLDGAWRTYTIVTAVVGLAMLIWTALAYQRDARHTGLVQRTLIIPYMSWVVLAGAHLA
jgi:hypothetical membrane protein